MVKKKRFLILALGNPILSDDSIGLRVAKELKKRLNNKFEIQESSLAGLFLLEIINGYETVIIIDALKTKHGKIGQVHKLTLEDLQGTYHLSSFHQLNFITALETGAKLGFSPPQKIIIYGIEIKDNTTFRETLTPELEQCFPLIVDKLEQEINSLSIT
jgi:hydrogenase maturation protease